MLELKSKAADAGHRWRFFRSGGVDQVRLDRGEDLLHLPELDQKLWVALACPTKGVEFDARTLALLDTDGDGRIRTPEIVAAVRWMCATHRNPGELIEGAEALQLSSLNPDTPEGARALVAARRVAADLGKGESDTLTVEDVSVAGERLTRSPFNGDGVITPSAGREPETRALVEEIMGCMGAVADRSGEGGISADTVRRFFDELRAYSEWQRAKEEGGERILPLGEGTGEAFAAYEAVRGKVEDFFARCRLAAYDGRAAGALNGQEGEFAALGRGVLGASAPEAAGLPLARVEAGRALPLRAGVNPAWAEALERFDRRVVRPVIGEREALSAEEWEQIRERLAGHAAWVKARPETGVSKLPLERIRALLAGNGRAAVEALIAEDAAHAADAEAIAEIERLLRYRRDLHPLLMSFVSFRDFYTHRRKALFQIGTLYLDGRSCELCVRVENTDKHAALAAFSKTCLVYCDCARPATGEKMTIAAAFMDGDSDYLLAGRNGVFYDRQGRDWDATITRIIDNPVSIRQAFWSPYKKIARFIEEQVTKRAAAAESAVDAKAAATVAGSMAPADKGAKPPAVAPAASPARRFDVGTVAALGVALGSIGTFAAAIFTKFVDLGIWIPVAMVVIMLGISGPSMLLAWMKLRQRNLGPILDANGWAVNTRARVNVPFGRTLTRIAALPRDAERSFIDPYAEKRRFWPIAAGALALLLLLAAAWHLYTRGTPNWWPGKKAAPTATTTSTLSGEGR